MYQSQMSLTWPWLSLWSSLYKSPAQKPGPIIVDIEGTTITQEEKTRLQHPLVGGVILFSRNYQNPAQLKALCEAIHSARDEPLLISIDHEGGRVQRCKTEGFTPLPNMRALGQFWEKEPLLALRIATETAYVLAAELRACGVDFSFTPVLDLDYEHSAVIGDRSFHRDPRVVTMLSRALIQGLSLAGMAACGKHFPGHGYAEADSHVAMPTDERELDDILSEDIFPYHFLGDMVLPSVMPAHVIYPKVDSKPAGFSKIWIQDILREKLNYQGLVFSDDLTMEGASVAGNITQRAEAALNAGCDMALVCNRPDLADQVLAELKYKPSNKLFSRLNALKPKGTFMDWETLQNNQRYQDARKFQSKLFSE